MNINIHLYIYIYYIYIHVLHPSILYPIIQSSMIESSNWKAHSTYTYNHVLVYTCIYINYTCIDVLWIVRPDTRTHIYVCMYIYMYIHELYMHLCTVWYTHVCTWTIYAFMYSISPSGRILPLSGQIYIQKIWIYIHKYEYIYIDRYIYIFIYYTYTNMNIYMYIRTSYTYIYIYLYIYIHIYGVSQHTPPYDWVRY